MTRVAGRMMVKLGSVVASMLLLCAVTFATSASAAQRADTYTVTFAARYCSSYSDVFANRARNNIMESLEDLGPDTQYVAGELVSPSAESKGLQGTACQPLENWQFTLGDGYQTRAVTGAWGSMSKVTGEFSSTSIVTGASVPELDDHGDAVPGKTVAGAVTITLSAQEASLASWGGLWVQGGTPSDPVLASQFGGVDTPEYGFASLRCATDAVNGDNVEYIKYPSGVRHVFCYAFYVKPPPTSGTIIVKKVVTNGANATTTSFPYNSDDLYAPHAGECATTATHSSCNISYDPNGFTLTGGNATTFYRGAGQWTIVEGNVPDYKRTQIECVSGNGQSTSTDDVASGVAQVTLAAGDTVTCSYTNEYDAPGGLSILKQTTGGVGTFGFTVKNLTTGETKALSATTTEPDVAVEAAGSPLTLARGEYEIEETSPSSGGGSWKLTGVVCNGVAHTPPVKIVVTSRDIVACTFTNHFTAAGSIVLRKVTYGAVGKIGFLVTPNDETSIQYKQTATTRTEGIAVNAVPTPDSAPTTGIALGRYTLIASEPVATADGYWELESIDCNGVVLPFDQGRATITLTKAEPHQNCLFTDRFLRGEDPPIEPDILTDLKITKTASPTVVKRGKYVTYRLTVTNLGAGQADDVVVTDHSQLPPYVISVHNPTHRGCRIGRDIVCDLGSLRPHHSVTLTVVLSSFAWSGTVWNRAVVGSSTPESTLANNVARAKVKVIKTPVELGKLRG